MLQKGNFWRRINFVQENMNVEDVFKEYITSFLWLTPILQIKRRQTWIMIWNEFDEFIVQHFYYNLTLGNPPQLIASRIRHRDFEHHLSIETRKNTKVYAKRAFYRFDYPKVHRVYFPGFSCWECCRSYNYVI